MSRRWRKCCLLSLVAFALAAPSARAAGLEIVPGSLVMRTLDKAGLPDNRAGAHPDRLQIDFELTGAATGDAARDLRIELPPGLGGSLAGTPQCARPVYERGFCPSDTSVGFLLQGGEDGEKTFISSVAPAPGQLAQFGSFFVYARVPIGVSLRPGDHGLTLRLEDQVQMPGGKTRIELWGVPIDHQNGVQGPRRPLLTLPTRCGPMSITLRARSWEPGAPWISSSALGAPLEGCAGLPFEPRLGFSMTDSAADAPTGIEATLSFPQHDDPDGLASSQLRSVEIAMPPGMSVSPGGAEGLAACSDAQFGLGAGGAPACPFASRVGSVVIDSPQSLQPLAGDVFLGQERPGERFRLLVAASAPGVDVKLAGALDVNPQSGQITARLKDLPQLSVARIALALDGGRRALLATPLSCGPSAASARFDPLGGGTPVVSNAALTVAPHTPGTACSGPPFAPALTAGSTSSRAGAGTSFSMTLQRRDGEQLVDRFGVQLPSGLSPALGKAERCDGAALAAAACPAASRVGAAVAEVGSGPGPAAIAGSAYLTGPYRKAPFGLALVFDAAIGPFDLGRLVVRGKVEVDSRSGRATIATDPLPERFEGIPLRFQTIGLDLDRAGFLRNPTSCAATDVSATIYSKAGASTLAKTPFRLGGCGRLGFKPAFAMSLGDRSQLRRNGRPDFQLVGNLRPNDANMRSLELSLPRLLRFDIAGLKQICARDDAVRGRCPRGSRVGTSSVRTPLLGERLNGPLYVVQPKGNGSPDLWASIDGLGVRLDLQVQTAVEDGRTVVDLANLPDLPMSKIAMRFDGGEDGLLALRQGVCAGQRSRRILVSTKAGAQNGAERATQVPVRAKGCGSSGSSRPVPRAAR